VCRDGLAVRHDHDPVDVALDGHHPERERPGHTVAVGVEGDRLVLVHGDCGVDHAGIEPMLGKGDGRGERSSARRSWIVKGPKSDCTTRWRSAAQRVPKNVFNSSRFATRGTGVAKRRSRGLDGPLGVGLLVAAGRSGDGPGVVPANFLGHAAEELEGCDHAFEDGLGAFEGERPHKGSVRVGPGRHEEGNLPPTIREVDVDVSEIGLEALAREVPQRDERFLRIWSMTAWTGPRSGANRSRVEGMGFGSA
jgi:hypothetical protein